MVGFPPQGVENPQHAQSHERGGRDEVNDLYLAATPPRVRNPRSPV